MGIGPELCPLNRTGFMLLVDGINYRVGGYDIYVAHKE